MAEVTTSIDNYCSELMRMCHDQPWFQSGYGPELIPLCRTLLLERGNVTRSGMFTPDPIDVFINESAMTISLQYDPSHYSDAPWGWAAIFDMDICRQMPPPTGQTGDVHSTEGAVVAGVVAAERSGLLRGLWRWAIRTPVVKKIVAPAALTMTVSTRVAEGAGFMDVLGEIVKFPVCLFLGCNEAH